jgi:hypothetical protein
MQLFPGNNLSGVLQQKKQNGIWLPGQANANTAFQQLTRGGIYLELSKREPNWQLIRSRHIASDPRDNSLPRETS